MKVRFIFVCTSIYIYLYIYTLAVTILKIFEPNFIMLFVGLIARLSSLMSKIVRRRWLGQGVACINYSTP